MKLSRLLKKFLWKIDAYFAIKKYPLNESLTYFGITGTDGKTTTSNFIYELAKNAGYKPLLITTVGGKFEDKELNLNIKSSTFFAYSIKKFFKSLARINLVEAFKAILFLDKKGFEKETEKHRTTPLAGEIRKLILECEAKGANFFILEVTSHAIDQHRVDGIFFDGVAYTNITNDHLDYHGTWENYAGTKAKLIERLKENGSLAINQDDLKSYKFLKKFSEDIILKKNLKLFEYTVQNYQEINPENFFIEIKENEVIARKDSNASTLKSGIKLLGKYNIYNALAAFSVFYGFNSENPLAEATALTNLENISGRMEILHHEPDVIVDFAHTPNGMYNALSTIVRKPGARVWVIFGCAGERDKFKRPEMGKIAYDFADNILITSEDPRSESLPEINNQIISGFKNIDEDFTIQTFYEDLPYNSEGKFIVRFDEPNINSRKNAILYALHNAKKEDIVLILGKGHETSMNYGEGEVEWNDVKFVKENL